MAPGASRCARNARFRAKRENRAVSAIFALKREISRFARNALRRHTGAQKWRLRRHMAPEALRAKPSIVAPLAPLRGALVPSGRQSRPSGADRFASAPLGPGAYGAYAHTFCATRFARILRAKTRKIALRAKLAPRRQIRASAKNATFWRLKADFIRRPQIGSKTRKRPFFGVFS